MKYRLVDMINNHSQEVADKVVEMWKNANILPAAANPTKRVKQIVYAALDEDGNAVGVSTAYLFKPEHGKLAGKLIFPVRQFILPNHRNFELSRRLLWSTYDNLSNTKVGAEGIVLVLENKKLSRKGYKKRYARIGFVQLHAPHMTQDVMFKPFGTELGKPLSEEIIETFSG